MPTASLSDFERIASVPPAEKMPKPGESGSSTGNLSDFKPLEVPGGSREPTSSKIRRFGRAAQKVITDYDPSDPHNLGRVAPIAVGAGLPIAAGVMAGPEAGWGTRVALQGLAGALTPHAEYATAKLLGQKVDPPTAMDVAKSAALNAGFASLGEFGAAKAGTTEAEVQSELEKLPQAERTVSNIKKIRDAIGERAESQAADTAKITEQDFRNRDFWKAQGLNDRQIDQVMQSPDLAAELGKDVQRGRKIKETFNTILRNSESDFKGRFDEVLNKYDHASVGANEITPIINKGIQTLEPQSPFREAASKMLAKKSEQMGGMVGAQEQEVALPGGGTYTPPTGAGATPAERSGYLQKVQAQLAQEKQSAFNLNPQDVSDLRTNLRRALPRNATNLEKKAYGTIDGELEKLQDKMLKDAGASNQEVGKLRDTYQDWGDFQDMKDTLDPREERFGTAAADALYGSMQQNPGQAMLLVKLAKDAEAARPGEVMPKFREEFTNKMFSEARAPGQPMEELKGLRKLQETFGSEPQTRAMMSEIYGKDSPLADPANFQKIVEAQAKPEPLVLKGTNNLRQAGWGILRSPYMRVLAMYAAVNLATGNTQAGSPFSVLYGRGGAQSAENLAIALAGVFVAPKVLSYVASSGNGPLQRAAVAYLDSPNAANAMRYAGELSGGIGGALAGQPAQSGDRAEP